MGNRIRAFIAIPLPREVLDLAGDLQDRLREQGLRMRWVRPTAIHLTLKFLGDIDPRQVADIEKVLAATASSSGSLDLAAKGLGVFPTVKKARVLWMGIAGETATLLTVQKDLETRLESLGFKPEKRRFNAHLTLARAKGRLDARRLVRCMETIGGFEALPFVARQIVLFQSDLRPDGAVYTRLASKNLE
jgi:2'-5' RNA ligase